MLSSKASEIDKIVGLEVGADDYVTKPFSFREVVARVRALRRRSEARVRAEVREKPVERPAAEAMVRVGRVFVDLPGHRLIRDGVQVPVTPKAFQLLAFLLRNAGQVFTREQLVERVWGYDYVGETRTVNVHVCSLRMRIEDDPSEPQYLQTVRGVGYVLRMSEAARDAGRAADVENERAERVVEFHVRSRRLEETRALAEARSAARTAAPDTTVTRSIPASVGFKP